MKELGLWQKESFYNEVILMAIKGGCKNMEKITRHDKLILECFDANRVPTEIKLGEAIDALDPMDCYEELSYQVHCILNNKLNLNENYTGTGKSFIFDGKYEKMLLKIISDTKDLDLKIHCYLSLATLMLLTKYSSIGKMGVS